jgi:hypothetical protein
MFAVLQTSLEQPIPWEALEAAVMSTETLAKPDCGRLLQNVFGIVVGNLSQEDALGFQGGLRAQGIETEVVDQASLPSLPEPFRPQSFDMSPEGLSFADYTGQNQFCPMSTLVFAAGGHVKHLPNIARRKLDWAQEAIAKDGGSSHLEMVPDRQAKEVVQFRLEFYFAGEPHRLQCLADETTIVRGNGQVLKFRDQNQLDSLLVTLASTIPPEQVNGGIKVAAAGQDYVYPSIHAFEEEIVWSLYRMAHGSGG